MNLFEDAPEMLRVCEANRFAGIIRLPLAMGFLTGKYSAASRLPEDDIRSKPPAWLRYFEERGSASKKWRAVLDGVKEILMSNGRTLAQGALGWIWARSACTVPIPGVRTVAHVEENVGAIDFGPLTAVQLSEISALLSNPNELVQSQGASP